MTPFEIEAHNRAKLAELKGDALIVAMTVTERWPDILLTSAARDYKDQARVMAENACAQRVNTKTEPKDRLKWIESTYKESIVSRALQTWFEQHPTTSEPDCVSAFIGIMRAFSPQELRRISKHLVIREREEGDGTGGMCIEDFAEAFDAEYKPGPQDEELCAYLRDAERMLGGRFIEKEGNEIKRHWQAK